MPQIYNSTFFTFINLSKVHTYYDMIQIHDRLHLMTTVTHLIASDTLGDNSYTPESEAV